LWPPIVDRASNISSTVHIKATSGAENTLMKLAFSRWLFNRIHTHNLIYNQCWEDPALDHAVLNIGASDRIVMITSGGCNALDYLLKDPARIDCVDVNPHQNALLELKLAAIAKLPYEDFFAMFGKGRIHDHLRIYATRLRPCLTIQSRTIWDRRISYFAPDGAGLYFHGTAGFFARGLRLFFKTAGLQDEIEAFQQIGDLVEQEAYYRTRIAPRLWSPLMNSLIGRTAVLSLLGVPAEQIAQIKHSTRSSISSFVKDRVEQTLTRIPIRENYFWRVYMNGYYPDGCCPNYLNPEHYETLRLRIPRIRIHTATVTDFLHTAAERFSIFVLLDHMDWLSAAPQLLEAEWYSILAAAQPGARIIYRSGGVSCDYIPDFALRRLRLQARRTEELHARDRVGTYGSFHFATVTP
jgi:S-adenosylmethionine-diacylglycerol 3-amino-3-carboxypropyl transferase